VPQDLQGHAGFNALREQEGGAGVAQNVPAHVWEIGCSQEFFEPARDISCIQGVPLVIVKISLLFTQRSPAARSSSCRSRCA